MRSVILAEVFVLFGISGYEPNYYDSRDAFIDNNIALLKFLKGQEFQKVFWVWDKKSKEWFRDCPVVVQLSKGLCTLCANKDSDFAIGWNNIDFKQYLIWYKIYEFDLEWRNYQTEQVNALIGQPILSVEIINYLHKQKIIYSKDDPCSIGKQIQLDLLHGVGFKFTNHIFAVTNGLDDNNIEIMSHDLKTCISTVTVID